MSVLDLDWPLDNSDFSAHEKIKAQHIIKKLQDLHYVVMFEMQNHKRWLRDIACIQISGVLTMIEHHIEKKEYFCARMEIQKAEDILKSAEENK